MGKIDINMTGSVTDRSGKTGLPPGTLVHVGTKKMGQVTTTVIHYDADTVEEQNYIGFTMPEAFPPESGVTWLDICGVHDVEAIRQVGQQLGVHPLVLEDIANTKQRPKAEHHEGMLFVVIRMAMEDEEGDLELEQVSLLVGNGYVVTFQERPGDVFEPVRERIRQGKGRIRRATSAYLMYALLDVVVDGYFASLEKISIAVDDLEEELLEAPTPATLEAIHALRRRALVMRRAGWPVREMVQILLRPESGVVDESVEPYLHDLYDHVVQVVDTVEVQRETLGGYAELYLSSVSNKMNEVMKVLTVIATMFIPLTFVAGIYGMNFEVMPELKWRYGYAAVWGLMAVMSLGMLAYFRRKRWF